MNWIVTTYLAYLTISIALTVWVARSGTSSLPLMSAVEMIPHLTAIVTPSSPR